MSFRRGIKITSAALLALLNVPWAASAAQPLPAGISLPALRTYSVEEGSLAAILLGDKAVLIRENEGSPFVPERLKRQSGASAANRNEIRGAVAAKAPAVVPLEPEALSAAAMKMTRQATPATPASLPANLFRRTKGEKANFTTDLAAGLRIKGNALSATDPSGRQSAQGDVAFETIAGTGKRLGISGNFARQADANGIINDVARLKLNAAPTGMLKLNGEFTTKSVGGRQKDTTASFGFETSADWKKRSGIGLTGSFMRQDAGGTLSNTTRLSLDANPVKGLMFRGNLQNRDGAVQERASSIGFETTPDMRRLANLFLSGTFSSLDKGGSRTGTTDLRMELSPLKTLALKGQVRDESGAAGAIKRTSSLLADMTTLRYFKVQGNFQTLEQTGTAGQRSVALQVLSDRKLINWKGLTIDGKYLSKSVGSTNDTTCNLNMAIKPLPGMDLQALLMHRETTFVEKQRILKAGYTLPNIGRLQGETIITDNQSGLLSSGNLTLNAEPWKGTKINMLYAVKPHLADDDPLTTVAVGFNRALSDKLSLYGNLRREEISADIYRFDRTIGVKAQLTSGFSLAADHKTQETDGVGTTSVQSLHLQKSAGKRVTLLCGLESISAGNGVSHLGSYAGITANPFAKVQVSFKKRFNTVNGTLAGVANEELKIGTPLAKTANGNLEINGNLYYVDKDSAAINRLKGDIALTYKPSQELSLTSSYKADVEGAVVRVAPYLTWEARYGTEF